MEFFSSFDRLSFPSKYHSKINLKVASRIKIVRNHSLIEVFQAIDSDIYLRKINATCPNWESQAIVKRCKERYKTFETWLSTGK